ncbi:MAG: molybdopterin-binding/glycosyltransferase family 2 protein [Rhizobiaceae bacterium]|nr:molybdopterin-binding/glycosyltransferase family 2 protein [Rhizobiaceae bacterium]
MKFGPLALGDAEGALLAHAITAGRRYPKAHRLTASDLADLAAAGVHEVIAAVLDADDVDEDTAAARIAARLGAVHVEARPAATGRVNLYAAADGLFVVDKAAVDALNAVDPAITLATLADEVAVEKGRMVATVKIIPFAVAADRVAAACAVLDRSEPFAVRPFSARRVGLIQTELPGLKESVLAKTRRVTEARLARSGSAIGLEMRSPHDAGPLAEALRNVLRDHDMAVVFGASALCDFDDVIPAAIRLAGGELVRAGMPVDPGNLLVLGRVDGKVVLGAPGCARSPKENGFDWVLDRLLAGLDVTSADIAGMGVGGLLMEIAARPQPREAIDDPLPVQVDAIVLAAGRSSRMGGPNKLLARFGDEPLVRRVVHAALASKAASVTVVTGHQEDRIREALRDLHVSFAPNPDYESGLSSSLKVGIAALPKGATGALVMLGDMPDVAGADVDRLISGFVAAGGRSVVRATHGGKRGNPVILPHSAFAGVAALSGDTGARHLIEAGSAPVIDVEIGQGASLDVDTAEAMAAAGGVLQG